MRKVFLKNGREKPAKCHHPWIFSGAIKEIPSKIEAGEIVQVFGSDGEFIAYGYYCPLSKIRLRLLEWRKDNQVDESWWKNSIINAVERRREFINSKECSAFRIIHAEADGLPGLIVDKYDDFLVIQSLTAGIERIKDLITRLLAEIVRPQGIYEKSPSNLRKIEGLSEYQGILFGQAPPELITIQEHGHKFLVNITRGQKTGFYLDQKKNRKIVACFARNKEMLDCFCYTGGFSVYALKAGARLSTLIDCSEESIRLARKNLELNEISLGLCCFETADVFEILRTYKDSSRFFDLIILDPPKFAPTGASVQQAVRAYKDINFMALKILNRGGFLVTFSCSAAISILKFKEILWWASLDAGKEIQIIEQLHQDSDHPVKSSVPESEYLKGLVCRVI